MKHTFQILRNNAQSLLEKMESRQFDPNDFDINQAIEELNVYHIELEMQVEELQKNQLLLEKNKHYLKYLFDKAPIGYVVMNQEGWILELNDMGLAYFGQHRDLLKNYRLQDFISANTYPNYLKCIRSLLDLEAPKNTEVKFRRMDQTHFWARIDMSLQEDPITNEKKILCAILDVNDRVQAEDELKEKQAQLIHASRLASLGEMATGVAHELNQPLSRIKINAQGLLFLMKKFYEDTDQIQYTPKFNAIIYEVDRAATIIENMRGFARSNESIQTEVNLKTLIENSLIFFKEQFKIHNIQLNTRFHDNLSLISINEQRFEQIVVNLLSNARYAVDKKQMNLQSIDYKKHVSLCLYQLDNNKYIVFEVTDNGKGMTVIEKNRCFDPFYTTKEIGEGTGLGLSIVHNIIKEMNGSIDILSAVDEGTTIRIYIPIN